MTEPESRTKRVFCPVNPKSIMNEPGRGSGSAGIRESTQPVTMTVHEQAQETPKSGHMDNAE
jgi:hypothetical protein